MKHIIIFFLFIAGSSPLFALSEVIDGITWEYSISAGKAVVVNVSTNTKGEIIIPAQLGGCPVTSIGASAFFDCSSLTAVTIPDGVTSIGESAFSGCSALTSVTIPDSVTRIGVSAFSNCSSLTEVTIPDSVTRIGVSAFYYCSSLTEVTIPDGVTEIGYRTFSNCSALTSVTIPDSVTRIGESAFYGCSELTEVTIPDSVTEIGENAFSSCSSLTEIIFKGGVPEGIGINSLHQILISFPQEYGAEWEQTLGCRRFTVVDVLVPSQVKVETRAEQPTPKTIKVTYTVKSELPSVKVRAVAWKDGKRSFANIVPVRTGEGVPKGESVSTNEEHSFVWDVASDWATDLDKVAVEILVQEGTLLPQELITIPATKTHPAMTITRNALAEPWLFDALVWCVAEGDDQLMVKDGHVSVNGVSLSDNTALLNYLYGRMGYKVLAGEDLEYAERATRLDFADSGFRQVSVKIEEGE